MLGDEAGNNIISYNNDKINTNINIKTKYYY